uniref:Uncharacterized protein n=1 Tax=viral metagenome TaxID=1070528 RepID=A0A6M3IG29_9ZZZZ
MANEFKHKDAGSTLTQTEDNATDRHAFDSQAVGDLLYASSTTVCSRLGIGSTDDLLTIVGGVPAWAAGRSGEGHITILGGSYNVVGQGTWAWTILTTGILNAIWSNSSNGNGDNVSYQVYLAKGTYTLVASCAKGPNRGIVDVDIDASEVASFDLYAAGYSLSNRLSQASIAVATSGLKTLKWRVDGKNVSGTDYYCPFHYIALWRTA